MRLADSMLCHYFDATTEEGRATVLSTALVGAVLVGGITAAAGWVASPVVSRLVFTSPHYAYYFRLTFLSVGLSVPQSLGYAYLRAQNRSGLYLAACMAGLLFRIGLILWMLVWRHMGFAAMVWTALIACAIEAVLAGWYVLARSGLSFDFRLFRKLSAYGGPLAIGSVGMLILHYGDRFVLSRYVSLSEIGVYALGYKIGMLVAHAQGGFTQYWNAQMFPILRRQDGGRLYVRVSTYYTVASISVALTLSLFSRPLLQLMVPGPFQRAADFVPIIAVAYVLRGLGEHFRTVCMVKKRTGVDAMVILFGVAICGTLYGVLIPRMGAWGAATATVSAFGAMVPLSFWWAQRITPYVFEWKRIGVASACGVGLYACGHALMAGHVGPGVAIAGLCSLAFPGVLLGIGFLTTAEKVGGLQQWLILRRCLTDMLGVTRPPLNSAKCRRG
jgi:O-antigen/teichoic acid export membrane protein